MGKTLMGLKLSNSTTVAGEGLQHHLTKTVEFSMKIAEALLTAML